MSYTKWEADHSPVDLPLLIRRRPKKTGIQLIFAEH